MNVLELFTRHQCKLTRASVLLCTMTTLCFFILKTSIFLGYPVPVGDEHSILSIQTAIEEHGFMRTWSSGNFSPVYFLIANLLKPFFDNNLYLFRSITVVAHMLLLIVSFSFAMRTLKIAGFFMQSLMLFFVSCLALRIYWQGINDSILHLFTFLLFTNIYFLRKHWHIHNMLSVIVLIGLLLGTRLFALLIVPAIFFFFTDQWKKVTVILISGIVLGCAFHIPSIVNGNGFASIDKNPESGLNWFQRNHLSQSYIYEGKIPDGGRVSWDEVRSYLSEHGAQSLPNSISESIYFEPVWTIKEFFNDFWYSFANIYLPYIGIGPILFILLFVPYKRNAIRASLGNDANYVSGGILAFWAYTAIISLVVIMRIEPRWYFPFIFLGIILTHFIIQKQANEKNLGLGLLFLNVLTLMYFQIHFIFFESNPFRSFLKETIRPYIS